MIFWLAVEAAGARLGLRRDVGVFLDARRIMPLCWGLSRYRLLLPVEARHWDAARLESVLLHELAHIKRGDLIVQLFTRLACAIHWFNPLVWLAAWRLHVEQERACDDVVLRAGVEPAAYAEHLVHVATSLSGRNPAGALAMARPSRLEGRLLAVLNNQLKRTSLTRGALVMSLLLAAVCLVPLAMLRAESADAADAANAANAAGQPGAADVFDVTETLSVRSAEPKSDEADAVETPGSVGDPATEVPPGSSDTPASVPPLIIQLGEKGSRPILLRFGPDGRYLMAQIEGDPRKVRIGLAQAAAQLNVNTAQIIATPGTPQRDVVAVMDACREAGISRVILSTRVARKVVGRGVPAEPLTGPQHGLSAQPEASPFPRLHSHAERATAQNIPPDGTDDSVAGPARETPKASAAEVIHVKNARAAELAKLLQGLISAQVDLTVDERQNTLVVSGPVAQVKQLEELVGRLDVSPSGGGESAVQPTGLEVTAVRPLYLTISFKRAAGSGYFIGVERQAAESAAFRRERPLFLTVGVVNKYLDVKLVGVRGAPESPTLVLQLLGSGEMIAISENHPFRRVEGYETDLRYAPEDKRFANRHVGDEITAGGTFYEISAISPTEVVVMAKRNDQEYRYSIPHMGGVEDAQRRAPRDGSALPADKGASAELLNVLDEEIELAKEELARAQGLKAKGIVSSTEVGVKLVHLLEFQIAKAKAEGKTTEVERLFDEKIKQLEQMQQRVAELVKRKLFSRDQLLAARRRILETKRQKAEAALR